MIQSAPGLVALVLCALATGRRWEDGFGGAAAAFGLLLWPRFAMLWIGVYPGLAIKGPQGVSAVQILVFPLAFLSNVFAAPGDMPAWPGAIAEWNPLSATAGAARELFGGAGWADGSFAAAHSVRWRCCGRWR